ncbi:MAG: DUF1016 N-terminal domain-containing protein [Candidatus Brocadiales bacterium]|nr:DUF1016 N-terminal domain-containing protein [Candidatus Brocadiales bacterium]
MTVKKKLVVTNRVLQDISLLIERTRSTVVAAVNVGLTMLYWQIGKRISAEILKGERAKYGEEIIATLSQELIMENGQGFNYSALTRMVRFAEVFPDSQIVATLSQQLSWSHFKELLPLEKPLQRDFYAEMCRVEWWSVRTLRQKVDSMLYERQKEEDAPIGLILWAGKKHETVELLELEKSSIRVAEYLTELPPREVLEAKLHTAVEQARHRFENLTTQKGL